MLKQYHTTFIVCAVFFFYTPLICLLNKLTTRAHECVAEVEIGINVRMFKGQL